MSALPKGIRQRGDSYVADVSVGGKRRTGSAPTLEEAILLRQELLADLRGEPVSPARRRPQAVWTIRKALGVTLQSAPPLGWSGTDWGQTARHHVEEFAIWAGRDRPLDTVDAWVLREWAETLEGRGLADGTINRYLAALSKVMSVAEEMGGLAARPKFPRRKTAQGRVRFLSKDEEQQALVLLQQWGKEAEADLFVVLIDTGLRVGEALRLEIKDIDHKRKVLTVWETKNGHPRTVPMTSRVSEALQRRAGGGPLVQRPFAFSRHSFSATWSRLRAQMGLSGDPQFVPHALRHTCASRLVQKGVALRVVQEWLGHKTITITMRYAHLAPENLMAAAKVLEED